MAGVSNHESEIVRLVAEAEQSSLIRDRVKKSLDESYCLRRGLPLRGVVEADTNPQYWGPKKKKNNPS